jgi:diphthamide synthase (EF-2-diphthine--ammonia ligase)
MATALAAARGDGVTHVVFGDLFLEDVRAWREARLAHADWVGVFPLWGESTRRLAAQFLQRGHRAVVCCVDTQQADAMFCGREFDQAMLAALPATVDPCGENGEFHTLAFSGPLFAQPLDLDHGASYLRDGRFAYTDFTLREGTRAR